VGFAFVDDTDLVNVASSALLRANITFFTLNNAWTGGYLFLPPLEEASGSINPFGFFLTSPSATRLEVPFGTAISRTFIGHSFRWATDASQAIGTLSRRNTLGVSITMDGNNRYEKEYLLDKAMEYADQLRSGSINKKFAWYSCTSSFMKTTEYPMEAVSFSEDDWDEILQPVMGILLQRSGIASTFPRKLVRTAAKYQGLGAQHPFYLMLIKQLLVVLIEPQHGSHAGNQLVFSADELHHEAGWPGHFADIPVAVLSLDAITNC
jgi:hypothetical protein